MRVSGEPFVKASEPRVSSGASGGEAQAVRGASFVRASEPCITSGASAGEVLVRASGLCVSFSTSAGEVQAVRGASFELRGGETLALVGESGCGKSATARAIMRLDPSPPARLSGELELCGLDVMRADEREMTAARGELAAMIFQDPMTSLDPTMRVGDQIVEGALARGRLMRREAASEAVRMLELVGIANAAERARQYPHELSGGMRQRVMIASAMACRPRVLIADEPTTALDVTIQAQIMELLDEMKRELGAAMLLITHDLGVVAGSADRVAVMYAGRIAETGATREIYRSPAHPYTQALLASVPTTGARAQLRPIPGAPPDLLRPPRGCAFAPRCEHRMRICVDRPPMEQQIAPGRSASCWLLHPDRPSRPMQDTLGLHPDRPSRPMQDTMGAARPQENISVSAAPRG